MNEGFPRNFVLFPDFVTQWTFFPNDDTDRITELVTVERTFFGDAPEGVGEWVVRKFGRRCMNHDGEWEGEPQPSSRDDEFFKRCRFDRNDALSRAYTITHPKEEPDGPH